jgi:hypothetical protein
MLAPRHPKELLSKLFKARTQMDQSVEMAVVMGNIDATTISAANGAGDAKSQ